MGLLRRFGRSERGYGGPVTLIQKGIMGIGIAINVLSDFRI